MSELIVILLVALPLALLFLAVGRRIRRRPRTWVEISYWEYMSMLIEGKRVMDTNAPRGGRKTTRYWGLQ